MCYFFLRSLHFKSKPQRDCLGMGRFIVPPVVYQRTQTPVEALLSMPCWLILKIIYVIFISKSVFYFIYYYYYLNCSYQGSWYPSNLLTLSLGQCIFLGGLLAGLVEGLDEVSWKTELHCICSQIFITRTCSDLLKRLFTNNDQNTSPQFQCF